MLKWCDAGVPYSPVISSEYIMAQRPILVFSRPEFAARSDRRTGNNLSGLGPQRIASIGSRPTPTSGDEVQAVLDEPAKRVDDGANLHRLRAQNPAEAAINLGEYLRDISVAIVAALSSDSGTHLRFACDPHCFVSPERALSIGLIVVELVTNAVKYAHPTGVAGEIKVACTQGPNGTITVEVADDGVGLPEGMDPRKTDSLGLLLVRSVAERLGAPVNFVHSALGLSCVLQMQGELPA
jgi:two-component sensor histidine kinase